METGKEKYVAVALGAGAAVAAVVCDSLRTNGPGELTAMAPLIFALVYLMFRYPGP